jgi:hypothetical protein
MVVGTAVVVAATGVVVVVGASDVLVAGADVLVVGSTVVGSTVVASTVVDGTVVTGIVLAKVLSFVCGGVVTDFAEVSSEEPAADANATAATPIRPPSTQLRRTTPPFSPGRTADRWHARK